MGKAAIIYFSSTGHTHLMAEAIAEGIQSHIGAEADLLRIHGAQIQEGRWTDEAVMQCLQAADAIVFGSPTYMGTVAAQFKAFADHSSKIWMQQAWKDKLAGGFTHGSALSGDKFNTLMYFSVLAAQQAMVWVNPGDIDCTARESDDGVNRMGAYLGVMGQTPMDFERGPELHPGDRLSCERYGLRLAKWMERIQ
jgi:NAD(P)H dehydrogenase (quinone)